MPAHLTRFVASLPLLGLLAACGPSDPLEEARRLQEEEKEYSAPLATLRELVEERPDDPEVQYRYGVALLASGQPSVALWPLQRAAESPEWEVRANVSLASIHTHIGSFDKAMELMDRVLEKEPDNPDLIFMRASARVLSKRHYEEALADVDRILELDPDYTNALVPRVLALLALNRVEEAEEDIAELEALHRDDSLGMHGSAGYCAVSAKFAEEKGEPELAEERYDGCLAQFPADANLVQEAVDFYDGQGRSDRSNEILRSALDEVPEAFHYRLALANRLRAQDRGEEGRDLMREATGHESPQVAAEGWAALARILIEDGEYEAAVDAFQEARRLAGDDEELLLATADALIIAGRAEEALEVADKIGFEGYSELVRGRAALAQGAPARALEHFDAGIRLWPNNPFARYYAAVAAEQVGDFERAVEDYRYAMRISVQSTDAYLRLARLQDAAGRPEQALSTLQFTPGGRPFEREAALLELRLRARLGRAANTPARVLRQLGAPADRAAAATALAEGVRAHAGAEAALKTIREVENLDLHDPAQAEALEALVRLLIETGQGQAALGEVEGALRAQPEAAEFHALRGVALAALGREAEARRAFEGALERDAEARTALLGLARIESAAGEGESARALYQRALALDPDDAEAGRGLAGSLAALERTEDAESQLAALLREHPYDREAAMALAELRLSRGAADERTRELARRAVFFGGGEAARELLERAGGPPAAEEGASEVG